MNATTMETTRRTNGGAQGSEGVRRNGGAAGTLIDARAELPKLMENLGQVAGEIREAIADAEAGNLRGAAVVCDDALFTLAELEAQVSALAAGVARWKVWAEEREGGAA